jgi:hypothetical protein
MPVAFTDIFNSALDDLNASVTAITGLQCVNDPRNANPPCAFIDAPSFTGWNYNIVKMAFPVRLITLGPGNLDAQRSLLNMMSKLLAANLGITDGRPTIAIIGGAEYPAYDVTVNMQAQTA